MDIDMKAVKRANLARRAGDISVVEIDAARMGRLVDFCMRVKGDGLTDPDLRVLTRLTTRGVFDDD